MTLLSAHGGRAALVPRIMPRRAETALKRPVPYAAPAAAVSAAGLGTARAAAEPAAATAATVAVRAGQTESVAGRASLGADTPPWNGALTVPGTAARIRAAGIRELEAAPPDPDGPGMFRCAAPGYLSARYEAAGLREITEWDVGVELVTRSPAQYWEMLSEHVSLAVAALAQVGEPARERIAKAVMAQASAYEHDGRIRIPGMARCVAGTK